MFNNSNNHSVSISVSDDDTDELTRMRARVRKKRRKSGPRGSNGGELARWVVRKLVRYWMFLIFLPLAGLLLFEASRIGRKSNSVARPELGKSPILSESGLGSAKKPSLEKKSEGNLNRLDPMTRVVGGVRERKSSF